MSAKLHIGQRVGSLTCVEIVHGYGRKARWVCDCGGERVAHLSAVAGLGHASCKRGCPAYRAHMERVQIGERIGHLVAMGPHVGRSNHWHFRCDCGAVVSRNTRHVRRYEMPRCVPRGCAATLKADADKVNDAADHAAAMRWWKRGTLDRLVGQVFNGREVVKADGFASITVRCGECGRERDVQRSALEALPVCRCQVERTGPPKTSLRHTHPLTWWSWKSMINRTTPGPDQDKHHAAYKGVSVCERWKPHGNGRGFRNFLADMGERPSQLHTLDRISPHGDYDPRNTRWALPDVQRANTRAAVGQSEMRL